MNTCQNIQPLLIDFVDKTLDREHTEKVRQHLESCKACREEVDGLVVLLAEMNKVEDQQPDAVLKENFAAMLEAEKQNQQAAKVVEMKPTAGKSWLHSPFSQLAAGVALLIAGMMLGLLFRNDPVNDQQVAELSNEVNALKDMLIMSKLEQPSASQRIMAANYLEEVQAPNTDVLQALINTMNTDDNSNVRMAALNALSRFTGEPMVRDALVETLSVQTDPIIQISLINILVQMNENRAVDKMKELINDNSTNESVKKLAEKGVLTLI